ncbi:MAG: HypC/HybG/HupF family hydrogenase formation chaperone [Candidatus Abyssubacteria bacterium]|jgi:hydrogenase expression/formation protein HypC|nr:HypC/HybG/HupF family hydrogenase formation chaperone [Candidatus Abyssubacteria bacterium]
MCLAIPAKVIEIDGEFAAVDIGGLKRRACISLLDEIAVGDFVIVHAGFAINKLDLDEAEETLKLFRQAGDGDS